jgi:hypothetical protein
MIREQLSEAQFALASAVAMVALAIIGSTLMTLSGMTPPQVGQIVVPVMGFAGMIMMQWRSSIKAETRADKIEVNLAKTDSERADQLRAIQSVGEDNHVLLNSGHLAALNTISVLADRLANKSDSTPEDRDFATRSATAFKEHAAKQTYLDKKQEQVKLTPLEQRVGPDPGSDPTREKH